MKVAPVIKAVVPKPTEIGREALIVVCGALLAALIMGQLPGVRQWIKDQWGGAQQ